MSRHAPRSRLRFVAPWNIAAVLAALFTGACSNGGGGGGGGAAEEADPPEIVAGERLFLETRFAQFFADNFAGFVNAPLVAGDPALDTIEVAGQTQTSPFAGQTMSCGACHMVDQGVDLVDGGIRTYGDFARHSPITARADGQTQTPRNSPPLVNASIARAVPTVFHLDAEFPTLESLVVDTLEGRNYGWLASEKALAEAHIALVIRQDDGSFAADFGSIPYADLLDVADHGVPEEFLLPLAYRIDMATATDAQIVDAVAALIAEYTRNLAFVRDDDDHYAGSPYDRFLVKNGLPQAPDVGETALDYARRLAVEVAALANPKFISGKPLASHPQTFSFGPTELEGLQIFLRETPLGPNGGAGNCVSCHTPPDFTDFAVHNVGFSQEEYDATHGPGTFLALSVPDLTTRDGNPDLYLPASPAHPAAAGPFRASVDAGDPSKTDLGLWNVFANADLPAPQAAVLGLLDVTYGPGTSALPSAQLLPLTEGLFKTPGLRDLSHSGPYGHAGSFVTLSDVLNHYLQFSGLATFGFVRNADPRLEDIRIVFADISPLAAFLRSLNEDYE